MEAIPSPCAAFIDNKEETPQMKELVTMFGHRLGDQEITPDAFATVMVLFSVDVERGIDGFSGKPFEGRWGNGPNALPPLARRILLTSFSLLLKRYLPEAFAAETNRIYKELMMA